MTSVGSLNIYKPDRQEQFHLDPTKVQRHQSPLQDSIKLDLEKHMMEQRHSCGYLVLAIGLMKYDHGILEKKQKKNTKKRQKN